MLNLPCAPQHWSAAKRHHVYEIERPAEKEHKYTIKAAIERPYEESPTPFSSLNNPLRH